MAKHGDGALNEPATPSLPVSTRLKTELYELCGYGVQAVQTSMQFDYTMFVGYVVCL